MTDSPQDQRLPIPVICDQCQATGMAGDEAFAAIPDILGFDPVPRRSHVNNWTAEHQRAFIAALAITGSPAQAARVIGRHAYGAEQLRYARGGKSFSAAWDAALDVSRDREYARLHRNLSALAISHAAANAAAESDPFATRPSASAAVGPPIDEEEYHEATVRIRDRLSRARRLLLIALASDPAKRAAWEELVGPTDWDRAAHGESQADEPSAHPQIEGIDVNPYSFRNADMLLTAEAGLIPDLVGGFDLLAILKAALAAGEDGEANDAHVQADRSLS